jgi:hypothetical protein
MVATDKSAQCDFFPGFHQIGDVDFAFGPVDLPGGLSLIQNVASVLMRSKSIEM